MKCSVCGHEKTEPYHVPVLPDGICTACHWVLDAHGGKDNYGNPRIDFVKKLQSLTDEQLIKEGSQYIWLAAYAANNPRSDYHWQCDFFYKECCRRGKTSLYQLAYDKVAPHN